MQLFKCQSCHQLLYFENTQCLNCNHQLGYNWGENALLALNESEPELWHPVGNPTFSYRYCANVAYHACNWLIDAGNPDEYCLACSLNRTIPNLEYTEQLDRWQKLEVAKHRVIYSLVRLNLPVINKDDDPVMGLAFDFLEGPLTSGGGNKPVRTGHKQGVVTINTLEADDAVREQQRQSLAEPYRTLLGHFRHEVAHYYWMCLAQKGNWLTSFRTIFGDERQDYTQSLASHYAAAPQNSWAKDYISAYASTHPWEDWAETWAHYLHIVDTLETANAFGMRLQPGLHPDSGVDTVVDFDPYWENDFDALIDTWLPVTFALNSLNRSMGQPDLYPFVLTQPVLEKMKFIHQSIHQFHQL